MIQTYLGEADEGKTITLLKIRHVSTSNCSVEKIRGVHSTIIPSIYLIICGSSWTANDVGVSGITSSLCVLFRIVPIIHRRRRTIQQEVTAKLSRGCTGARLACDDSGQRWGFL